MPNPFKKYRMRTDPVEALLTENNALVLYNDGSSAHMSRAAFDANYEPIAEEQLALELHDAAARLAFNG